MEHIGQLFKQHLEEAKIVHSQAMYKWVVSRTVYYNILKKEKPVMHEIALFSCITGKDYSYLIAEPDKAEYERDKRIRVKKAEMRQHEDVEGFLQQVAEETSEKNYTMDEINDTDYVRKIAVLEERIEYQKVHISAIIELNLMKDKYIKMLEDKLTAKELKNDQ